MGYTTDSPGAAGWSPGMGFTSGVRVAAYGELRLKLIRDFILGQFLVVLLEGCCGSVSLESSALLRRSSKHNSLDHASSSSENE